MPGTPSKLGRACGLDSGISRRSLPPAAEAKADRLSRPVYRDLPPLWRLLFARPRPSELRLEKLIQMWVDGGRIRTCCP